jgi:uncharacterized protein YqfA (UPF0365 family)
MGNLIVAGVAAVTAVVFLVFLAMFFVHLRLWLQAMLTGTPVSIIDILGMRLRKCPPDLIVHAAIALHQRGVKVPVRDVEGYYLASVVAGEQITSAEELADLVEDARQPDPDTPNAPPA